MRADGRSKFEPRPVTIETDYVVYPEGSILIATGNTRVLCNATVEARVPPWLIGKGQGWVTAEYAMLPRATHQRTKRESRSSRPNSRSLEISRLIGRALRAVVDMGLIGERTVTIDCDVLQADGGTRTASITGAYLALERAMAGLMADKAIKSWPLTDMVAAVSVGVVDGQTLADLDYDEDSRAEVDMNVVMDSQGRYIEIQGTAEKTPFPPEKLTEMLEAANSFIASLIEIQRTHRKLPNER